MKIYFFPRSNYDEIFFFPQTGFHDCFEGESHFGLHEILTFLCLLANILAFHDIYSQGKLGPQRTSMCAWRWKMNILNKIWCISVEFLIRIYFSLVTIFIKTSSLKNSADIYWAFVAWQSFLLGFRDTVVMKNPCPQGATF